MVFNIFTVNVLAEDGDDYRGFSQSDPAWGSYAYAGTSTLSRYGCFITTFAVHMAYANPDLRDRDKFNPKVLAKKCTFSGDNLCANTINNADPTFHYKYGTALYDETNGVKSPKAIKKIIKKALKDGKYPIVCANKQPITSSTHFSPVVGWDEDRDEPIIMNVAGGKVDTWERWSNAISTVIYGTSDKTPSYDAFSGNVSDDRSEAERAADVAQLSAIAKENELVGMPIDVAIYGGSLELPDSSSLSDDEFRNMQLIQSGINDRNFSLIDTAHTTVVFLGVICALYAVILSLAYLFDRTNNVWDISLLGVVTLGKYRLWDEDLGINPGYYEPEGKMYCNVSVLVKKVLVTLAIGFLLISGMMMDFIYWVYSMILTLF